MIDMFAPRLARLQRDLASLRSCLEATEQIRQLAQSSVPEHVIVGSTCRFDESARHFPRTIDWKVFDHSAAVTRLYAIYERFAYDVLESWLGTLPALYATYNDLPESIRNQHRDGLAVIFPRIGEGRYEHLTMHSVVSQLHNCISGNVPFELRTEAFAVSDRNLRDSELDVLFSRAGIRDCWSWIHAHPSMQTFIRDNLGSSETATSELNSFITYRNEAAHGEVNSVLDLQSLLDLIGLVQVICAALTEKVQYETVDVRLRNGTYIDLGEVTESYPRNNVIVAIVTRGRYSIGQELMVVGRHYCFTATILSLQLNDVAHTDVIVHAATEIGIQFDCPVRESSRLCQSVRTNEHNRTDAQSSGLLVC